MFNRLMRRLAGNTPDSLAGRMRRERFQFFLNLLESLPRPLRILDIGGTEPFWRNMGFAPDAQCTITLLNIVPQPVTQPGFISLVGDGCHLSAMADGEYDVVFSNSVIQLVGTWADQQSMAHEVHRVGRRYFIQTPNWYFPVEPHFLFPCFHYLPVSVRVWLLMHGQAGWQNRWPDKETARQAVLRRRLLSRRELRLLFPDGEMRDERCYGLTKSIMVYGGWPQAPQPAPAATLHRQQPA